MLQQIHVLKVAQASFMKTQLIVSAQLVMQLALLAVELVLHSAFHVLFLSCFKLHSALVFQIAIQINTLL